MKELEIITLDEGKEYFLVDSLVFNNDTYYLLSQVDKVKNVLIRKLFNKDGDEYLEEVDSNQQELLIEMFINKNKELLSMIKKS